VKNVLASHFYTVKVDIGPKGCQASKSAK